ncbi:MAG: serine/threonine protein kinase [Planctomycetaceae bacterium]|nr:serine/threonine protein kinase [Planctomycetales bacterium]MCB9923360.1 serine/threonine protein kinase [Planctomycetaceae bacterium]
MDSLNQPRTSQRARPARRQLTRTIGDWHLVRRIGEGTCTEVYQARPATSTLTETADYAVKMLKPRAQDNPIAIQQLQREAFISRRVRHPHLASILSSQTDTRPRFVVMPYVEGVNLASVLREVGRIVLPQALWFVRQTAEALIALHQSGWRHGDIKPANLIASANGHTTLVDLGLARTLTSTRSSSESFTGSLAYACPETFNPHIPFSSGSDVYSLGVTLYELLTGSRPFIDDDPTELAAAHLTREVPDPKLVVPHLPPRVTRLVRRMLAKDPLRRPGLEELVTWLVDLEIDSFSERLSA